MLIPEGLEVTARRQAWVLSRRQLYAAGVTRWVIRNHIRRGRWQRIGDQSVAVHNGPLSRESHRWAAVFQGGPRACLDGASALTAGGLVRFDDGRIRVSVPRGARVRRSPMYDIRQTRRWTATDCVRTGVPRTRPQVAVVRAALWARSDREAAYVLSATVQQRLASAHDIGIELLRIRRAKRRALLHSLVAELLDGAESLGELDVAAELRRRGLPAPTRQAVRRGSQGRYFLDMWWREYGLIVEVDGIHHSWAENVIADALRQNDLVLAGDRVLRLPLLGYRLQPDEFFTQIEAGLRRGGWTRAA